MPKKQSVKRAPVKPNKFKLLIDDRESNVFQYLPHELALVNYEIKRLNIGDYAIVDNNDKLFVVFERKTLVDYASSIKDGRHLNKEKLIEARKQTGCRIVYIVEGDAFPSNNKRYAKMSYKTIKHSINRLIVRDNFCVHRTLHALMTIQYLADFVDSMYCIDDILAYEPADLLGDPIDDSNRNDNNCNDSDLNDSRMTNNQNESNNHTGSVNERIGSYSAMDVLNQKFEMSDLDKLRKMWSSFKYLGSNNVDHFINKYTIYDIVSGRVSSDEIKGLKMPNGRKISTRLVTSLTTINKSTEVKILSNVNRISKNIAEKLLKGIKLKDLLKYSKEALSMKFTSDTRRLGKVAAGNILYMCHTRLIDGEIHTNTSDITIAEMNCVGSIDSINSTNSTNNKKITGKSTISNNATTKKASRFTRGSIEPEFDDD